MMTAKTEPDGEYVTTRRALLGVASFVAALPILIPGAITDAIEGQKVLREKLADVTHALLLATIRHSLAVASMLLSSLLGLAFGVLAALRRGSLGDRLVVLISPGGVSMPGFWLCMLLDPGLHRVTRLVPSDRLRWRHAHGRH